MVDDDRGINAGRRSDAGGEQAYFSNFHLMMWGALLLPIAWLFKLPKSKAI
ncbi:MAG: hypothetical protein ABW049_04760 [Spongiibacteraceae bacterium]